MTHRREHFLRTVAPRGVKVENLRMRVHPGIRAPAPLQAHWRVKNPRQPLLEDILDRPSPGLALPTGKGPAIVGADAFPTAGWCRADGHEPEIA